MGCEVSECYRYDLDASLFRFPVLLHQIYSFCTMNYAENQTLYPACDKGCLPCHFLSALFQEMFSLILAAAGVFLFEWGSGPTFFLFVFLSLHHLH